MRAFRAVALIVLVLATPAEARRRRRSEPHPPSTVVLDGTPCLVRWVDGDTFRFLEGQHQGRSARLEGYNTLETYGPVHRWGGWTAPELLALARAATPVVASGTWSCSTLGHQDRYGRLLVACPEAAAELVGSGLAMVYAVAGAADPALLDLQRAAQRRGAGIWAKGVPAEIVASVHSAGENETGSAYDRVVDTATGEARRRAHMRSYDACDEVCHGAGSDRSCMLYVPFEMRYRGRPHCLRR